MSHEAFHELIALRLYDEIDASERARLERHLESCDACRAFASEMEAGLGALASATRAGADLPADWTDRLREATRPARPIRRISPWWTAAAGFAAGVIATVVLARGPDDVPPVERPLSTWDRFHRDTPPPPATTEGQLARLGEYLRR